MGRVAAVVMNGTEALLAGLIDYAGLFPPAGLSMTDAVRGHAADLRGPQAWMLNRFIVPAPRLDEFAAAFDAAGVPRGRPWRLSVLVGEAPGEDLPAIAAFNGRYRAKTPETGPAAVVEAWEAKVADARGVERWAAAAGPGLQATFEVPPVPESWTPILDAIQRAGGAAKLRTGGVVPSAIPATRLVATFIWQCVSSGVPFKATAGLHHPVRAVHRLTYDAGGPTGMMHGFLNVFVAAALAYQLNRSGEGSSELAVDLLERLVGDTDVSAFRVSASSVGWRDHHFEPELLRHVRSEVALSFGSCSFSEPVDDLQALGVGLAVPGAPGNRP